MKLWHLSYTLTIACDNSGCEGYTNTFGSTKEQCKKEADAKGWRVQTHKAYCPKCHKLNYDELIS